MASSVGAVEASDGLSEARQKFMMRLWWQAFKVRDQQRKRAMQDTETAATALASASASASASAPVLAPAATVESCAAQFVISEAELHGGDATSDNASRSRRRAG